MCDADRGLTSNWHRLPCDQWRTVSCCPEREQCHVRCPVIHCHYGVVEFACLNSTFAWQGSVAATTLQFGAGGSWRCGAVVGSSCACFAHVAHATHLTMNVPGCWPARALSAVVRSTAKPHSTVGRVRSHRAQLSSSSRIVRTYQSLKGGDSVDDVAYVTIRYVCNRDPAS